MASILPSRKLFGGNPCPLISDDLEKEMRVDTAFRQAMLEIVKRFLLLAEFFLRTREENHRKNCGSHLMVETLELQAFRMAYK